MKYIERGWQSYRQMVVPADAPDVQVSETCQAFYAGAAIVFTTLRLPGALDPGFEETENDMKKMADLQAEIDAFGQQLDKRAFGQQER